MLKMPITFNLLCAFLSMPTHLRVIIGCVIVTDIFILFMQLALSAKGASGIIKLDNFLQSILRPVQYKCHL